MQINVKYHKSNDIHVLHRESGQNIHFGLLLSVHYISVFLNLGMKTESLGTAACIFFKVNNKKKDRTV